MFRLNIPARRTAAAIAAGLTLVMALPAVAQDAMASKDAVYREIESMFGGVPSFVKALPDAALAGAWAEERDLELNDKTALDPKTKALISLAVAAQIPCHYCIWADTNSARQFGATDEEIKEAVAMSALTRHWSTIFNGMQIDFETFKKELGGE